MVRKTDMELSNKLEDAIEFIFGDGRSLGSRSTRFGPRSCTQVHATTRSSAPQTQRVVRPTRKKRTRTQSAKLGFYSPLDISLESICLPLSTSTNVVGN